jgi:hypothetical protein
LIYPIIYTILHLLFTAINFQSTTTLHNDAIAKI